jgi:hypothetical protein
VNSGDDEHGETIDALLAALELELRESGRLSFATCEALRRDPELYGFEGCLAFLHCTVFAVDPETPPISRRRRVQACRLMLLSIGAHTDAPRWTSFQIEQLFEVALQIPGAELSDVVQAQFALAAEIMGPTPRSQANFIREVGGHVAGKRRRGHPADDFVWIALRLDDPLFPATETQAYLALHVLPRRLRGATREIILRTIISAPLAEEVAQTLAES